MFYLFLENIKEFATFGGYNLNKINKTASGQIYYS